MKIQRIVLMLPLICSVIVSIHTDPLPNNPFHIEGHDYGREVLRYYLTKDKEGEDCYEVVYRSKASGGVRSKLVYTKPDGAFEDEGLLAFGGRLIKDNYFIAVLSMLVLLSHKCAKFEIANGERYVQDMSQAADIATQRGGPAVQTHYGMKEETQDKIRAWGLLKVGSLIGLIPCTWLLICDLQKGRGIVPVRVTKSELQLPVGRDSKK